jgi:GNAT superfamily N-acetyltransferase
MKDAWPIITRLSGHHFRGCVQDAADLAARSLALRCEAVSTPEFAIEANPTPEQVQYLEDRLYEFNSRATGITDGESLAIFVRDERGRMVAGICGNTWGGGCEIRQFWVEESRRRQGLGTRLLGAAEEEARRRGCRQMVLTTFSFQAPAFYAKRGFRVLAAVDDYPRGHQSLLLRKELAHRKEAS